MSIITDIFKKKGITSVNELSTEEKAVFENWERILSKDEMSIEDIRQFCKTQCSVIEGKWADLNLEQAKKAEMIPYHTVYRLIASAIDSPKQVREALEKQLQGLLN